MIATDSDTPVVLSERAAAEIRTIVENKELPDGFALRVGVRGGGCSGMSYLLGFDRQRTVEVAVLAAGPIVERRQHQCDNVVRYLR